jgi:hypothetical protein
MAIIPNPWFKDLPKSFQTADREYIIIGTASNTCAQIIISNGSAATRLENLRRDETILLQRYEQCEKSRELYMLSLWKTEKRRTSSMAELQEATRRARRARETQSMLNEHINFIREVIWSLEFHLGIPLSRSPAPTTSRSNGLCKEDLVVV